MNRVRIPLKLERIATFNTNQLSQIREGTILGERELVILPAQSSDNTPSTGGMPVFTTIRWGEKSKIQVVRYTQVDTVPYPGYKIEIGAVISPTEDNLPSRVYDDYCTRLKEAFNGR